MVSLQLSEALCRISKCDFPAKWPTLLPELVQKLATADISVINGVLETADAIFLRFRDAADDNDTRTVVLQSVEGFGDATTKMMQSLSSQVRAIMETGVLVSAPCY
jgi:exportin-2 (importin alpha re-exporter)